MLLLLMPGAIVYHTAVSLPAFRLTGNAGLIRWVIISALYDSCAFLLLEAVRFALLLTTRAYTAIGFFFGSLMANLESEVSLLIGLSVLAPFVLGLTLRKWLHGRGFRKALALFVIGWAPLTAETPPELVPTPWDRVFSQGKRLLIIATFPDGSRIGGWFRGKAFATSAQQVFLTDTFRVGPEGRTMPGEEFQPPAASIGCLIEINKVQALEIIELAEEGGADDGGQDRQAQEALAAGRLSSP